MLSKKTVIKNACFEEERSLYNISDAKVVDCTFGGKADGESPLKECRKIEVLNCTFDLRYPLWHCDGITLSKVTQSLLCRAAMWYSKNVTLNDCTLNGIKAIRECKGVKINNCKINSPEFGWRTQKVKINSSDITSEYFLFEGRNISADNMEMKGKYSFQYVKNATVENSRLYTKDAFWHSENVTVKNCLLSGEYLGWYSKNLTLINCEIVGTQPLCYCKGLRLIDCTMTDCLDSFEYSEVKADVKGNILSVKNPLSGEIVADSYGEVIVADSVYKTDCKIAIRKKPENF